MFCMWIRILWYQRLLIRAKTLWLQALRGGETEPLPSSTSRPIRSEVWAWHIIGGKDEIEDKSNWQYGHVRLPLCPEQKAIITIAVSKHRPQHVSPTTHPEPRLPRKSARWPRQESWLFWASCSSGGGQGRDPIPRLQGSKDMPLSTSTVQEYPYTWNLAFPCLIPTPHSSW